MIEMGKILFCAMGRAMVKGVCRLYKAFRGSRRAKVGAMIVGNLALAPYTAPALAAITVIGTAVFMLALPVVKIMEV